MNKSVSSFLIFFMLMLVSSCSSLTPRNSEFTVIYVKSKGRIPTSPHFILKLDGSSILYNGIGNMPILGEHYFTIKKSEVRKIKRAFYKSNFSNFDPLYQSNIRDLPISSITYNNYEVRFQTNSAPKELRDLATILENLLRKLKPM